MNTPAHSATKCVSCRCVISERAVYCPQCGAQQPGVNEQTSYEYAAFISYRHREADSKIAAKVQEAIETYRFPKGVELPDSGETSSKQRTLGKCFRDEDELAAANSLPDSIRYALEKARTLVVVCSSHTPQSAWVEREIIAFCEAHGRDRVFTVLADGNSKECIPKILRTRTVVDIDGKSRVIPAEPLAADYRAANAENRDKERLRILAAVAGCGFDDLRQRERERIRRQRKYRVLFIAAALLVVGGLSVFGLISCRNAQIEESLKLTVQSQRQLISGDRYGAIETALQALPSSDLAIERPIVEEAKTALEEALEINLSAQFWRVSYVVEDESDIIQMVVSEKDGWFATMDDSLNITVRDALTGSVHSRFTLPRAQESPEEARGPDTQPSSWKLVASGPYLVAAEQTGSGIFTVFYAKTGKRIRNAEGLPAQSVITTREDRYVILVSMFNNIIGLIMEDVSSGLDRPIRPFENPGLSIPEGFIPAITAADANSVYLCIGNTLVRCDYDSGDVTTYAFPQERIIDSIEVSYFEGPDGERNPVIVTASRGDFKMVSDSSSNRAFTAFFDAFDSELNLMWSYEETNFTNAIGQSFNEEYVDYRPKVHELINLGSWAFACSAGERLLVFSPTGEVLFSKDCSGPIMDIGIMRTRDHPELLLVSTANLTLECYDPTGETFTNRLNHMLATYSNLSYVGLIHNGEFVLISQSLMEPNCIVSFHTDLEHFSPDPDAESEEHSLNELVTQAHEILDSVAQ